MVALLGFMAAITLVLRLAPGSPTGRLLHRALVRNPLERLSRFERHHLIYFVILAFTMMAGGEAIVFLGPEVFAAYALDLAVYFDALMVTYALSAAAMARTGFGKMRSLLGRPFRRRSTQGKRAPRLPNKARSDNDDDPAPALLAA